MNARRFVTVTALLRVTVAHFCAALAGGTLAWLALIAVDLACRSPLP